jgi:hypothetical protein
LGTYGNTYCWNEHYKFQKPCQSPNLKFPYHQYPYSRRQEDRQFRSQDISAAAANEILNAIGRVATRSLLDNEAPGVHCSQLYERIVFQAVFAKTVSDRFHHPQLQSASGAGREQDQFQSAADNC